jgi:hypothetical protein
MPQNVGFRRVHQLLHLLIQTWHSLLLWLLLQGTTTGMWILQKDTLQHIYMPSPEKANTTHKIPLPKHNIITMCKWLEVKLHGSLNSDLDKGEKLGSCSSQILNCVTIWVGLTSLTDGTLSYDTTGRTGRMLLVSMFSWPFPSSLHGTWKQQAAHEMGQTGSMQTKSNNINLHINWCLTQTDFWTIMSGASMKWKGKEIWQLEKKKKCTLNLEVHCSQMRSWQCSFFVFW